jgi:hypothetical protein
MTLPCSFVHCLETFNHTMVNQVPVTMDGQKLHETIITFIALALPRKAESSEASSIQSASAWLSLLSPSTHPSFSSSSTSSTGTGQVPQQPEHHRGRPRRGE